MRTTHTTMAIAAMAAAAFTLGGCNQSPTDRQATTTGAGTQLAKPSPTPADADAGKTASASAPSTGSMGTTAMTGSSSDSVIENKVTAALGTDPTLKAADIKVEAKAGTVTLSGTVANDAMRTHAHRIAATTPGVTDVVDNLSVKSAG